MPHRAARARASPGPQWDRAGLPLCGVRRAPPALATDGAGGALALDGRQRRNTVYDRPPRNGDHDVLVAPARCHDRGHRGARQQARHDQERGHGQPRRGRLGHARARSLRARMAMQQSIIDGQEQIIARQIGERTPRTERLSVGMTRAEAAGSAGPRRAPIPLSVLMQSCRTARSDGSATLGPDSAVPSVCGCGPRLPASV